MFAEQGWTVISAAAAAEITVRCARKRVGRYGLGANCGCWIVPRRRIGAAPARDPCRRSWRCAGYASPVPRSPRRWGKLGRLGLEPAVRYERERPGEPIDIDVKKLGRIPRPGRRITEDGLTSGTEPAHSAQPKATNALRSLKRKPACASAVTMRARLNTGQRYTFRPSSLTRTMVAAPGHGSKRARTTTISGPRCTIARVLVTHSTRRGMTVTSARAQVPRDTSMQLACRITESWSAGIRLIIPTPG